MVEAKPSFKLTTSCRAVDPEVPVELPALIVLLRAAPYLVNNSRILLLA